MQEQESVQTELPLPPPKPHKAVVTLKKEGIRGVSCLLGLHHAKKIMLPAVMYQIYYRETWFNKSDILPESVRTVIVVLIPGYTIEEFIKGMRNYTESIQPLD